jgi:hypothetical protein
MPKATTAEDVITYFMDADPAEATSLYKFLFTLVGRREAQQAALATTPKQRRRPKRGLPAAATGVPDNGE